MRTKGQNKKLFTYIMIPLAFTLTFALFLLGFHGMLKSFAAEWKAIFLAGAPEYAFEANFTDADVPKNGSITTITYPIAGEQYGRIGCEQIALQAPLYYGDTDAILEQGAGTYLSGSIPGEQSGILIGAHDTTYFAALEEIKKGDIITVDTIYGSYQYEVTDTQIADVMDTAAYELNGSEEQLILYTCYPFGDLSTLRNERFYVYADKISGPQLGE